MQENVETILISSFLKSTPDQNFCKNENISEKPTNKSVPLFFVDGNEVKIRAGTNHPAWTAVHGPEPMAADLAGRGRSSAAPEACL